MVIERVARYLDPSHKAERVHPVQAALRLRPDLYRDPDATFKRWGAELTGLESESAVHEELVLRARDWKHRHELVTRPAVPPNVERLRDVLDVLRAHGHTNLHRYDADDLADKPGWPTVLNTHGRNPRKLLDVVASKLGKQLTSSELGDMVPVSSRAHNEPIVFGNAF